MTKKETNQFFDYKLLGTRIKRLRNKNNITQEKLSDLVGLDRTSITKIESGENITFDNVAKIAYYLNVKLGTLIDGCSYKEENYKSHEFNEFVKTHSK